MDPAQLGAQIRNAREAQGLSLRKLAGEIGVSPGLLSQIENGKTKPSVDTLFAITERLSTSTDHLLGRQSRTATEALSVPFTAFRAQSASENPVLEMENGVRWEKLSTLDAVDVEALRVTYQPGGSSSVEGHLMRHFGIEHIFMVEGELQLQLEFDTHVLKAGDSVAFNSERPHLFVNASSEPAVGVWYIIDRNRGAGGKPELPNVPEGTASPSSAVEVLQAFRPAQPDR